MNRTTLAAVLLLYSVLLGGCLTGFGGPETTGGEGEFQAIAVSESPSNATIVEHSDSRVQTNAYLQAVIRYAVDNESGRAGVTVPEDDVNQTKNTIRELPLYDPNPVNDDRYEQGYYFEYQKTIVRVEFVILD